MSERPAADTGGGVKTGGTGGTGVGTPPPDAHPKTIEKPGTGKPVDGPVTDPQEPPKGTTPGWTGEAKYPDGFTMSRGEDGSITLTDPNGNSASWSFQEREWVSQEDGSNMPPEWSSGHKPGTEFDTGQGSPQAHPNP